MKKRLLCLTLGLSMALAAPMSVLADQESDLKAQINANANALTTTQGDLKNNETAHNIVEEEITNLDAELVDLMANISLLEADLIDAENRLVQKGEELVVAEAQCDEQYADMKTRIQYIYENGSDMTWLSYLADASSFVDLLNRFQYAQDINKYDREALASYEETVNEIVTIKENLEFKKEEMAAEQESLETQKGRLNEALEEKKQISADYEAEILALQEQANALNATIASQNQQLQAIQEEKRRQAEEEARRAAEEAARKAAEEEAQRQQEEANKPAEPDKPADEAPAPAPDPTPAPTPEPAPQPAPQPAPPSTGNPSGNAAAKAEALANQYMGSPYHGRILSANREAAAVQRAGIGSELANFACSFVGRIPYVVAGESLQTGVDCAGLVKAVYAVYGVHFDRNLELFNLMGEAVSPSTAAMQPGDVILYWAGSGIGHAAIYIGNGMIVNASDPSIGLCTRPFNYRAIASVRRFFCY